MGRVTSIGVRRLAAGIYLFLASTAGYTQQVLPAPLESGPTSNVPVAVQILRWHMLDNDVSSLAFRSMDALFTTRLVARAGSVWMLPRDDHPLEVNYRWQGQRFSAQQFLERTYTNALLVIKNGRIVSETYRNATNEHSRFIGWSMTKSITSVLVGCALSEGRINSLDTPVSHYLPELEGGGYDGVSIRHVMQMRSGVNYEERYDFDHPGRAASNHISSLVKNLTRFADAARTVPRLHEPGNHFQYKTLDTAVLGWLIERVSQGTVAAYTARCLWEPLGAEADGFYIMDGTPGTGREFSGAGFNATLRDFGRFGQMVLNGGVAADRRIVSSEWIRQSTQPTAAEDGQRGGYGLQWWTLPGTQAFAAIGLQGQYIYVDPATQTVVIKLSFFPPGDNSALDAETLAFMAATSAWRPD
jgi:CubicO group peptidase (beta-lactamase class C family)